MSSLFYRAVHRTIGPLVKAIWRPRVSGLENLPATGAFIVASNHLALVDSFVIPVVTPRQVRFLARADLWEKPGLFGWAARTFFTTIGTVPVERGTLRSAQGALEVALQVLREGDGFGIYPEGTRTKDGRLHKGRTGVAWLAEESGAPVIPAGLIGTDKLFRPGRKLPSLVPLTVKFGAPIDFSDLDPSLSAGRRRQAMTARIMDAIAELSGQERAPGLSPLPTDEA